MYDLQKKYTKYYVFSEEYWNWGKDVLEIYFQLASFIKKYLASGGNAIAFTTFLP